MSGKKIVEFALREVGIKEQPLNSNRVKYNAWLYGKEVSGPKYPWCGAFVSWVFFHAGFPLGIIDYFRGFAGCPFAVANVEKWGRIISPADVQPGDVVFFDWDKNGRYDHTGIFISDAGGGYFKAVEGNTAVGNDSNGGSVMIRKRSYNVAIFVRPRVLEITKQVSEN